MGSTETLFCQTTGVRKDVEGKGLSLVLSDGMLPLWWVVLPSTVVLRLRVNSPLHAYAHAYTAYSPSH